MCTGIGCGAGTGAGAGGNTAGIPAGGGGFGGEGGEGCSDKGTTILSEPPTKSQDTFMQLFRMLQVQMNVVQFMGMKIIRYDQVILFVQ